METIERNSGTISESPDEEQSKGTKLNKNQIYCIILRMIILALICDHE